MDFETMLKLVNAGFTKEEIMKFAAPAPVPTPATPAPDLTALTGKVDALTDIIAKMQLANAKNASSQGAGDTGVMGAVQSFFGKPQGGV